jgi:hypothetical protein
VVGFFKNRSGSVPLVVMSLCIGTICIISGLFFFVPGILAFAFHVVCHSRDGDSGSGGFDCARKGRKACVNATRSSP